MAKILIVDDEKNIIKTISSILQDEGHVVFSALRGDEAHAFLAKNEVDIVILDVWLPDADGIDILEKIIKLYPDISVIMISGHGSIDIAVKSTKVGAFDFIEKPPSMERVVTAVNNAYEKARLRRENRKLRKESIYDDDMVGSSKYMEEIRSVIDTAAKTSARVFITGESGTGKELVARAIYMRSSRSDRPFIKVNCAAIPEDLIESELFGHEKGSFTGALSRRLGKFEVANGGTLFLDEVCDMSMPAQAKVLRVLQEQQFERVGGNETINVDVRVISATNIDVMKAIEEGKFREDLFFRLNVIPIQVPRLSDRSDDIPMLVDYFLGKFSEEHGIMKREITPAGMALLKEHEWRGNVRELKNIIERLTVMVSGNMIDVHDIVKHLEKPRISVDEKNMSSFKKAKEEFEKEYIVKALKMYDKNITLTSQELGIERSNLHRKIKQYEIDVDSI